MNAHKLNAKPTRAYKKHVKEERKCLKRTILRAADEGKKQCDQYVDCPENLEWLKEKGFKFKEYKDSDQRYNISWDGC